MSMSDPLGDMLTRIRNGQRAGFGTVRAPARWRRRNASRPISCWPRCRNPSLVRFVRFQTESRNAPAAPDDIRGLDVVVVTTAKTDEEKAEVSDLLTMAEGRQELDEIETYFRKRQKIRKPVRDLNKLIDEFAEFPELVEKARSLSP